eukprot:Rmarinus@m.30200
MSSLHDSHGTSSLRDFQFLERLGKGSSGEVYKVKRKADSQLYVIKQIDIASLSEEEVHQAINEANILASLDSCYVIQYFDSFIEDDLLNIVMELCEGGNLTDRLQHLKTVFQGKPLPENLVWDYFFQIALGLHHIHSKRILHRDLKTMNVFLDMEDNLKIGDLGVARALGTGTYYVDTVVGTPYYLSPELCEDKPYNEKSDVWALGCIIYEACNYKHPFDASNQAALVLKILRGKYEPVHTTSTELRTVVDECLTRDQEFRPTVQALLTRHGVQEKAAELGFELEKALTCTPERSEPWTPSRTKHRRNLPSAGSFVRHFVKQRVPRPTASVASGSTPQPYIADGPDVVRQSPDYQQPSQTPNHDVDAMALGRGTRRLLDSQLKTANERMIGEGRLGIGYDADGRRHTSSLGGEPDEVAGLRRSASATAAGDHTNHTNHTNHTTGPSAANALGGTAIGVGGDRGHESDGSDDGYWRGAARAMHGRRSSVSRMASHAPAASPSTTPTPLTSHSSTHPNTNMHTSTPSGGVGAGATPASASSLASAASSASASAASSAIPIPGAGVKTNRQVLYPSGAGSVPTISHSDTLYDCDDDPPARSLSDDNVVVALDFGESKSRLSLDLDDDEPEVAPSRVSHLAVNTQNTNQQPQPKDRPESPLRKLVLEKFGLRAPVLHGAGGADHISGVSTLQAPAAPGQGGSGSDNELLGNPGSAHRFTPSPPPASLRSNSPQPPRPTPILLPHSHPHQHSHPHTHTNTHTHTHTHTPAGSLPHSHTHTPAGSARPSPAPSPTPSSLVEHRRSPTKLRPFADASSPYAEDESAGKANPTFSNTLNELLRWDMDRAVERQRRDEELQNQFYLSSPNLKDVMRKGTEQFLLQDLEAAAPRSHTPSFRKRSGRSGEASPYRPGTFDNFDSNIHVHRSPTTTSRHPAPQPPQSQLHSQGYYDHHRFAPSLPSQDSYSHSHMHADDALDPYHYDDPHYGRDHSRRRGGPGPAGPASGSSLASGHSSQDLSGGGSLVGGHSSQSLGVGNGSALGLGRRSGIGIRGQEREQDRIDRSLMPGVAEYGAQPPARRVLRSYERTGSFL